MRKPKFKYGQRLKVVSGFYSGVEVTCKNYYPGFLIGEDEYWCYGDYPDISNRYKESELQPLEAS